MTSQAVADVTRAGPTGGAPPRRSVVLDGLRGAAILLVVLSHSWIVWPEESRGNLGSLDFLFESGSVAVSIFFVVTGFLVTRAFRSTYAAVGPVGPPAWLTRRLIRLTVQVWVLLAAVALMARWDPTDTASEAVTRESLLSAATYTWNTYVRDNALAARSDIGALYFLSIDVQFFCAFALVFLLLARTPRVLTGTVVVVLTGATVWRALSYERYGWFHATLSTVDRMDSILWGVLAALVAARLTHVARRPSAYLGAATLVLLGTIVSTAFFGLGAYFTVVGPVVGLSTALLVLADSASRVEHGYAERLWSLSVLTLLGRASLTLFLWHIPVFEAVGRHTGGWQPLPRTLLALAVLATVVVLVERFVARPVDRWARRLAPAVRSGAPGGTAPN